MTSIIMWILWCHASQRRANKFMHATREDRAVAPVTGIHDLLLFDLDGTLSDPLLGFARSMNYALCHFGHKPLELPAYSAYVGPPLDESFAMITSITSPSHIKELWMSTFDRPFLSSRSSRV